VDGSDKSVDHTVGPQSADLSSGFHIYGCMITTTDVTFYLDNVRTWTTARPVPPGGQSPFYLLLDLAMGGGWPNAVPPSGYYDLWVNYVRVYR
jgi:beta-glucanase (GH16 family)